MAEPCRRTVVGASDGRSRASAAGGRSEGVEGVLPPAGSRRLHRRGVVRRRARDAGDGDELARRRLPLDRSV